MADKDKRAQKREDKLRKGDPSPEKAAKLGRKKGVKDAFCAECETWYNTSDSGEVNRHAH